MIDLILLFIVSSAALIAYVIGYRLGYDENLKHLEHSLNISEKAINMLEEYYGKKYR